MAIFAGPRTLIGAASPPRPLCGWTHYTIFHSVSQRRVLSRNAGYPQSLPALGVLVHTHGS